MSFVQYLRCSLPSVLNKNTTSLLSKSKTKRSLRRTPSIFKSFFLFTWTLNMTSPIGSSKVIFIETKTNYLGGFPNDKFNYGTWQENNHYQINNNYLLVGSFGSYNQLLYFCYSLDCRSNIPALMQAWEQLALKKRNQLFSFLMHEISTWWEAW